jgi:hypothetical protein
MQLRTLDDLKQALAANPDGAWGEGLLRAWRSGDLVAWLDTRNAHDVQPDAALLARIREVAARLPNDAELGLFALLYTLIPDHPLVLMPGVSIDVPGQIEAAIAAHPKQQRALMAALTRLAVGGRLVEWAKATECAGWSALTERLRKLPDPVDEVELLPGYAVRWQFSQQAPFPAGETELDRPEALAAWIDRRPEHRALGLRLLESGWLGLWLESTGRLPKGALEPLRAAQVSPQARLEMLLRLLDTGLAPAKPQLDPSKLNFGKLAPGARIERILTLKNKGRGHVWGTCLLEGQAPGLRVEPQSFDGAPARLRVTLDTTGVAPFTDIAATLAVHCYDGRSDQTLRVPILYRVRVPLAGRALQSLFFGGAFGLGAGLLRLWAEETLPASVGPGRHLDVISMDWVSQSLPSLIDALLLGIGLLGLLIGIGVVVVNGCRR